MDLWGCCNLRDIFRICPDNNIKINNHIQECSIVSAFSPGFKYTIHPYYSTIETPFLRRAVCNDFNKTVLPSLKSSKSPWIIVDLRSLIYDHFRITIDNYAEIITGRLINITIDSMQYARYNYKIEKIDMDFDTIKPYLDNFIYFLKKKYGTNIIVCEIREAEYALTKEGHLSPNLLVKNQILMESKLYSYLIENLKCWYIPTMSNILSDDYHMWGEKEKVHYVEEYYLYAKKCIDAIISKEYETICKKYIETTETMFKIKYGVIPSRYNLLKQCTTSLSNKQIKKFHSKISKLIKERDADAYILMAQYFEKIKINGMQRIVIQCYVEAYKSDKKYCLKLWTYLDKSGLGNADIVKSLLFSNRYKNDAVLGTIARMYRDGKYLKKDYKKSIQYYKAAFNLNKNWTNELADLLIKCKDEADCVRAYKISLMFAYMGDVWSQIRIARLYYYGIGTEINMAACIFWINLAARTNEKYAIRDKKMYELLLKNRK